MSEEINPMITSGRGKFLDLLFEITSAFGTVGLSTGVTSNLSDLGKLIVSAMMSIGKLGPLTLALAISNRRVKRFSYSEEHIMVG
jgi:trk system potassium uptake protein TrkH